MIAPPAVARDLAREHPVGQFTAPMALQVGVAHEMTLLGLLDPRNASTTVWPASEDGLADEEAGPLAHVIAVHGWLVAEGSTLFCPAITSPTPPRDSPFVRCPGAWITAEDTPISVGSGWPVGIPVQWSAYQEFIGKPGVTAPSPPVEETWLLRLVEDPRPNADPKRGWLVVSQFQ